MLAGPDNNIGKYTPSRVVSIEGTAQYFDERAITPLINFLNGAREAGYTTYIMTAYRSYATQEYLLNGRASQIAWPDYPTAADYAEAELYVAAPGESDHQTGLAVDIADRYYGTMDASQMDQGLLTWLREHCAEYGFILRYPSAKSSITGRTSRGTSATLARRLRAISWTTTSASSSSARSMSENAPSGAPGGLPEGGKRRKLKFYRAQT